MKLEDLLREGPAAASAHEAPATIPEANQSTEPSVTEETHPHENGPAAESADSAVATGPATYVATEPPTSAAKPDEFELSWFPPGEYASAVVVRETWDGLAGQLADSKAVDCGDLCASHARDAAGKRVGSKCSGRHVGGFSPSVFVPSRRALENFSAMQVLVFDVDHATSSAVRELETRIAAEELAAVVVSTHSHAPEFDDYCMRVLFQLSRPLTTLVDVDHVRAVVAKVLTLPSDKGADTAATLFYAPSHPRGRAWARHYKRFEGQPVNVDAVLSLRLGSAPNSPAAVPSAAPVPASVDLDALKARLDRIDNELVKKALAGEPIADPAGGSRNSSLLRLSGALKWKLWDVGADALCELFEASFNQLGPTDPGEASWSDQFARMWERDKPEALDAHASTVRGNAIGPGLAALRAARAEGTEPTAAVIEAALDDVADVTVTVTKSQADVTDKIEELLARGDQNVFRHAGVPVRVARDGQEHSLVTVVPASLAVDATKCMVFENETRTGDVVPPAWAFQRICAPDRQPSTGGMLPRLTGLAQSPILLPTGRLVTAPGYDADSGLYLTRTIEMGDLPEPTPSAAQEARALLLELLREFSFAGTRDRDVAIAQLLTLVARPLYEGATPLLLVSGNTPGVGKSYLQQVLFAVATGGAAASRRFEENPEEFQKVLIAALRAGTPYLVFDNADSLQGSALNAAITSPWIEGRTLGASEQGRYRNRLVMLANGNNVVIAADTNRRVVVSNLATNDEHPEDRPFARDTLKYAHQNRPALLGACFTMLRAVLAARARNEAPTVGAYGSFEDWSSIVAGAVVLAGGADVTKARPDKEHDPENLVLRDLLAALSSLGDGPKTAAHIVTATRANPALVEVLKECPGARANGGTPTKHQLSQWLVRWRNKVVDGRRLQITSRKGESHVYSVEAVS